MMFSAGEFRWAASELIFSVLIFLISILWCYNTWTNRWSNELATKLKGPPNYPIVGSMLEFFGTPQDKMEKWFKFGRNYGIEPFKFWFGPYFTVVLSKPEDMQIVLNSSHGLQKPKFYRLFLNSEGLVSAPVEKWKKHRRLMNQAFSSRLLKRFIPIFIEKDKILVRNLKKELGKTVPFDIWDYISSINTEKICQTAMGYDLNSQSNKYSEFHKALVMRQDIQVMRIVKPWLYPDVVYRIYRKLSGIPKISKLLHQLPLQVIKEKKRLLAQHKKTGTIMDVSDEEKDRLKLFLDVLLELNETGSNYTEKDIRDEVETFIVAGSETSSITSCFCLLMLAIHQDIQDKVYNEIYDVLGDSDEAICIESIHKLSYLEQVLMETLRLYPAAPIFFRQLEDDVKIFSGDYILPKDTAIGICPAIIHRSPELYQNPLNFNPENFNQENIAKRHKYSFMAFSGGPRNCIGSKYAMLSIKILVVIFLQNFSVHTNVQLSDVKLKLDLMMRSVNGYPVTIKPRVGKLKN